MIRRFVVWFLSWALRGGLTLDEARLVVERAFPRRDQTWRAALVEDARLRNRARLLARR